MATIHDDGTSDLINSPHKMCGMCNTFPNGWASAMWRCAKIQGRIESTDDACEHWTPRESWKIDPPLYTTLLDRERRLEADRRIAMPLVAPPPATCQPRHTSGFIYFLECGEFVKIGFSTSPNCRVSSIATGSPHDVRIIGLMRGTYPDEKSLHKTYAGRHHAREWFRLDDVMRADIRRLCGARWERHLKVAETQK